MDLYLVRHAVAEQRDAKRWPDDARRPLTARGEANFRRAARGLRRIAPNVEVVLSSPYARAWQTAEILRKVAGWPAPQVSKALGAGREPCHLLDALHDYRKLPSAALVGHEPNLSLLASILLTGDLDGLSLELRKGAVALLAVPAWPVPGEAILRWSASPKLLRAIAPKR